MVIDRNPWWAQSMIHIVLFCLGAITLAPMLNILAISLSEAHAVTRNPLMLYPQNITLEAYKYIFATSILMRSFMITIFVTVVGTFLNLMFTIMAAYGISKTHIPGHAIFVWMMIIPMLFGAGLIPTYLLLKSIGLINSIWVLVILGLVNPFNLILMRNFFWSIPESLEESARIDGASDLVVLWRIILPLSKPVIATIGLFYGVAHWNDYFMGLFYITNNEKWPLQVVLRSIIIDQQMLGMGDSALETSDYQSVVTPQNIKAATIIFAIIPVLAVYPFLQKYFVKGILLGSVKG